MMMVVVVVVMMMMMVMMVMVTTTTTTTTVMVLQLQYRTNKPVSPAIYLVQVLNLSPRVVDGSTYLVPQALVNVLPKRQDEYIGTFIL